MKHPTSFRLSHEALRLLAALAKKLGLNKAGTLEVMIRDRAKAEGVGHHEREGSERPEG